MSTLVFIVADSESQYYPHNEATAKRLFGDIIEKTGATNILALRADSSNDTPRGISDLAKSIGIDCRPVQIDRLDPSIWTKVNPDELWSDYLETMIVNSQIRSEGNGNELCFMVNSGMVFQAALLYSMYELLGGSLWATIGGIDQEQNAIRLDRNIPEEGVAAEAILAGIAEFRINNSGSNPTSSQLQGLIDGIPSGKGIENSLRPFNKYFIDKDSMLFEKMSALETAKNEYEKERKDLSQGLAIAKKAEDKFGIKKFQGKIKVHEKRINDCKQAFVEPSIWALNSLGRYNANLTLAQHWKGLAVKDYDKGLVIFIRSVQDSKRVVKYLKEHRAAFDFDKFAFVIGGIDVSDAFEISEEIHQLTSELLDDLEDEGPSAVVSSPRYVCYNIDSNGDLLTDSSEVMEILHRIRKDNNAIEWSIDVTGVVNPLRPAVFQYTHLAKIPTIYMSKNPKKSSAGVYVSGQRGSMHLLKLPENSDFLYITDALENENLGRFLATFYKFYDENPNSVMGIEKTYGENRPYHYNRDNFPTGHPMRVKEIPTPTGRKKSMDRQLAKAIESGLVYRSSGDMKDIRLTPVGVVAGALLVN